MQRARLISFLPSFLSYALLLPPRESFPSFVRNALRSPDILKLDFLDEAHFSFLPGQLPQFAKLSRKQVKRLQLKFSLHVCYWIKSTKNEKKMMNRRRTLHISYFSRPAELAFLIIWLHDTFMTCFCFSLSLFLNLYFFNQLASTKIFVVITSVRYPNSFTKTSKKKNRISR